MYLYNQSVNAYTYMVMGLSAVGGVLANKYGFARMPFGIAFLVCPLIAFYQKKEADFNVISVMSK